MSTPSPHPSSRFVNLARVAAIAAAALIAYWPALHGGWIWDDTLDVTDNRLLRDAAGLWDIWFHPTGAYDYYPIKFSLQWVQWHLWATNTFGYHVTNVALHVWSSCLVWRVLKKLGVVHAWLGGLLFAVHPLAVESVAWIAEFKNTLSLPPLLLAFSFYLDFDAHRRRRDFAAALALFLTAMLCKASVVMFPPVLLLHAWWQRGRLTRRDALVTAPFFAISLVLGCVTIWFQRHVAIGDAEMNFNPIGGVWSRLLCAGSCALFYAGKALLPVNLMPIYPQWSLAPAEWWVSAAWPVIIALGVWAWVNRATWGRHVIFGGGWFLLFAAPVLGFLTITSQRFTWAMDHLVYVPLLGLIGLGTAGLSVALARLRPAPGRLLALGLVVLGGSFVWLSRDHAKFFVTEEGLWRANVRRNPDSWYANYNLGNALHALNRGPEALLYLKIAQRLHPSFADVHYNLANVLREAGRLDDAVAAYREAIRLRPSLVFAHANLAIVLAQLGRTDEAIAECEATEKLRPDYFDAHLNAGLLLVRAGRPAEALAHFADALRLAPDSTAAHFNLAKALAAAGRTPEAIAHFEAAMRRLPDNAQIYAELARALAAVGRVADARMTYARARELDPALPAVEF